MAQLPTSSLIVILDIERFGERPDGVAADLRDSMYQIVGEALNDAGIAPEPRYLEDRGDGLIVLLPEAGPVEVIGAFVRELETLVRHRAASRTPAYRMRLRVAIGHGFVRHDGKGWIGTAINTSARLVDSDAVRKALSDDPGAHIAVIVSDGLYQDVVAQGHPSIDASRYREAAVRAKEVDTRAWVLVPYGGGRPDAPPPPAAPASESHRGNVYHGDTVVDGTYIGYMQGTYIGQSVNDPNPRS